MSGRLHAQLPIDATLFQPRFDSMVTNLAGRALGWRTSRLVKNDGGYRVTEEAVLGEYYHLQTDIQIDRRGGMRWIRQGGTTTGAPSRVSLEYRRGRVRGVMVAGTRDGPVMIEADTTIPEGTIDDISIPTFLPTLPWAEGAHWTFPVFVVGENAVRQMTLTVNGTASVSLTSGPVDTWEAELVGGNAAIKYYVTKTSPHRIARFEIVGTGVQFLLVN